MAAQMDFPNGVKRIGVDVALGGIVEIGRGHEHVVHIQQQAASGATHDLGQEIGFRPGAFRKGQIRRRVFQQHPAAQHGLHLVDVIRHAGQRFGRIGQRQQVVQEMAVMGRPRQMFRKTRRVQPVAEVFQSGQVVGVQPAFTANGQAHAVDGNREPLGQDTQLCQGSPAIAHVVLGMHLKPANRGGIVQNVAEMLRLVADTGQGGQMGKAVCGVGHVRSREW